MDNMDYDRDEDLRSPARTAAILGVIAMTLHITACCTSIFGLFGGTITGGIALFMARGVQASDPTGEAKAYAAVGTWTGVIAVIWGVLVGIGLALYIGVYVAMIIVMVVAGA